MALWNKQEPLPATKEAGPIPVPYAPAVPQHKESFPMAMLTREEVPTTPLGSGSDLLLGAGAEFEGKLTFKGTVRIDAKFTGSTRSRCIAPRSSVATSRRLRSWSRRAPSSKAK